MASYTYTSENIDIPGLSNVGKTSDGRLDVRVSGNTAPWANCIPERIIVNNSIDLVHKDVVYSNKAYPRMYVSIDMSSPDWYWDCDDIYPEFNPTIKASPYVSGNIGDGDISVPSRSDAWYTDQEIVFGFTYGYRKDNTDNIIEIGRIPSGNKPFNWSKSFSRCGSWQQYVHYSEYYSDCYFTIWARTTNDSSPLKMYNTWSIDGSTAQGGWYGFGNGDIRLSTSWQKIARLTSNFYKEGFDKFNDRRYIMGPDRDTEDSWLYYAWDRNPNSSNVGEISKSKSTRLY